MSGKSDIIDDGIESLSDPEKMSQSAGTWGDQISATHLEELAPNGEGEYILNIINNMTEKEAVAIVTEAYKFHAGQSFL